METKIVVNKGIFVNHINSFYRQPIDGTQKFILIARELNCFFIPLHFKLFNGVNVFIVELF